jgi:hypothetical protein
MTAKRELILPSSNCCARREQHHVGARFASEASEAPLTLVETPCRRATTESCSLQQRGTRESDSRGVPLANQMLGPERAIGQASARISSWHSRAVVSPLLPPKLIQQRRHSLAKRRNEAVRIFSREALGTHWPVVTLCRRLHFRASKSVPAEAFLNSVRFVGKSSQTCQEIVVSQ